jgi:hypothetical protein
LWWFEGNVELTKVRNEQPAQTEKAGEQEIEIRYIKIDDIAEGTRLRAVDSKEVGRLVRSFADIGLQVPIRVQRADTISGSEPNRRGRNAAGSKPWILVSGGHRLEAARQAGHKKVPCIVSGGTEADRELGEITENLFRKELTVLERSDQTVRYRNLTNRAEVLVQNVPKPRGGRPRSGASEDRRSEPYIGTEARRCTGYLAMVRFPVTLPSTKSNVDWTGFRCRARRSRSSRETFVE